MVICSFNNLVFILIEKNGICIGKRFVYVLKNLIDICIEIKKKIGVYIE